MKSSEKGIGTSLHKFSFSQVCSIWNYTTVLQAAFHGTSHVPTHTLSVLLFNCLTFLDLWTRHHTVRALWAHCQKPNARFLGWEDRADFHLWCDQRWKNIHNSRYRLLLEQALGVLEPSFLCLTLLWDTSRNSKRARDTSSDFGLHLSPHARPSVRGHGPEALPEEWCAASGSWPGQAGEEC